MRDVRRGMGEVKMWRSVRDEGASDRCRLALSENKMYRLCLGKCGGRYATKECQTAADLTNLASKQLTT